MGDLKNKVIAREYVEKNYIKKKDLLKWLEKEIQMCRDPQNKVQMLPKDAVDGMIAAYLAIFYYIEGGNTAPKFIECSSPFDDEPKYTLDI